MRDLLPTLREWARDYEPAVAKTLVAAFLQILVVAGVALGDLPKIIDAVLAFIAVLATVVAGRSIRNSVYSPVGHDEEVTRTHVRAYTAGARDQEALGGGR